MDLPLPFQPSVLTGSIHLYRDGGHKHCHKLGLTDAECDWASEWWRSWYTADYAYGRSVVWFFLAAIGVFTVRRAGMLLASHSTMPPAPTRLVPLRARLRGVASRSFRFKTPFGTLYTPPVGMMALMASFTVFCLLLLLVPQPYYWPGGRKYGTTNPLDTRAGWMSLAMLPFMIILASKWNLITVVTGVSHEQLNVLHRWVAWAMYVATLVHTFALVVANRNQNAWDARYKATNQYWTGFVALVPQTLLQVLSLRPLRNRAYEVFKKLHYFFSLFYVVMLFVHCELILSSIDYFFGLAAAYGLSLVVRWTIVYFKNGQLVFDVASLDDEVLEITIPTASRSLKWKPGQHYLVRFSSGMPSGHPFTVASIPEDGQLHFIVKRNRGITDRLAGMSHGRLRLDGPYGGIDGAPLNAYDRVLLAAGGSGLSFLLGHLRELTVRPGQVKHIDIIFSSRSAELCRLLRKQIRDTSASGQLKVQAIIHLTGSGETSPPAVGADSPDTPLDEKLSLDSSKSESGGFRSGRPDLKSATDDAVDQASGARLAIAVCGPDHFTYDIRQTAAACQAKIARGEVDTRELALHTESYGW